MLYPERPLTFLILFIIPVTLRAKFLLLFFGLLTVFGIFFPAGSNIADVAHLGGMLTGIFFARYAIDWQWPQFKGTSRRAIGQNAISKVLLLGPKEECFR